MQTEARMEAFTKAVGGSQKFRKFVAVGAKAGYVTFFEEDAVPYFPISCKHTDNIKINPHGFGLDIDLRENILSTENNQCKRCGFYCAKKQKKHRANKADGLIIRANIGTGYFLYDGFLRATFQITEQSIQHLLDSRH